MDYYTIFRNVLPYSNLIKIPLTLQRTFPFFQTFMTFYKTKGSLFDRFRKFKELLAKYNPAARLAGIKNRIPPLFSLSFLQRFQ